jgi:hypothetical protein
VRLSASTSFGCAASNCWQCSSASRRRPRRGRVSANRSCSNDDEDLGHRLLELGDRLIDVVVVERGLTPNEVSERPRLARCLGHGPFERRHERQAPGQGATAGKHEHRQHTPCPPTPHVEPLYRPRLAG